MSRNTAIAARHSPAVIAFTSAIGVPGRGFRKFSGTQPIPRPRSSSASSTRCSGVSPMPRMPPEQSAKPSRFAVRIVSSCDS